MHRVGFQNFGNKQGLNNCFRSKHGSRLQRLNQGIYSFSSRICSCKPLALKVVFPHTFQGQDCNTFYFPLPSYNC